ncbi:hypothetical protein BGZ98_000540 [Dissophora globulifera]|nr:hypothetical protein BGZ98_000540 [Dissophora globulifera]
MPLSVRVGSSRLSTTLRPCLVNVESEPVAVSSSHFDGLITVRIQKHHPATPSSGAPTSAYFDNHSRLFSLQWQGRFKATNTYRPDGLWTADDVLFVAEVENKVHPPRGLSIATKFIRLIDPSFLTEGIWLEQRPWVGSYLVTGMNVLRVWGSGAGGASNHNHTKPICENTAQTCIGACQEKADPSPFCAHCRLEEANVDMLMRHYSPTSAVALGSSSELEDVDGYAASAQGLSSYQRRRFFMSSSHRQNALFHPDLVLGGDFFNNFTNFETMRATMVFSIHMDKVLEGQPLRFVCKSRPRPLLSRDGPGDDSDDVVFFVVQLDWQP